MSAPAWARDLERRAEGPLFIPDDDAAVRRAAYEAALRLYTRSLSGRPAAVLRAASERDVSLAVTTAAAAGVPLSVRGGGHSGAGFGVAPDGLMLDLSTLREVRVEPAGEAGEAGRASRVGRASNKARDGGDAVAATSATSAAATSAATSTSPPGAQAYAVARPGATWADYDAATQEHGLASTGGIVSTTGVAGLTLGGGIGALRGLHGLAVDNLVAADVVLADGSRVRADAAHEPELFWALRGGGGNFGVVTAFHFAVHPVSSLTTGVLGWPLERAQDVAAAYRKVADELPDRSVAEFVFTHAPDGEPMVLVTPRIVDVPGAAPGTGAGEGMETGMETGMGMGTGAGAGAGTGGNPGGEPLLPALRALSPSEDSVTARSYTQGQRFLDPGADWGHRHYWNTVTLRHFDEEVVALLATYTFLAPSPRSAVIVEHLHGEVSRRDPDSTAVGFRHAPYNVFIEAKWTSPEHDAVNRTWARELADALRPFSAGGAYVNYLPRDATPDDLRAAHGPGRYERLRRIKAHYDPANVFRVNQNIPPAD